MAARNVALEQKLAAQIRITLEIAGFEVCRACDRQCGIKMDSEGA